MFLSSSLPSFFSNWLIHQLYVRTEHDECLKVIEQQLKDCNGQSEYPLYVKGFARFFSFVHTLSCLLASPLPLPFPCSTDLSTTWPCSRKSPIVPSSHRPESKQHSQPQTSCSLAVRFTFVLCRILPLLENARFLLWLSSRFLLCVFASSSLTLRYLLGRHKNAIEVYEKSQEMGLLEDWVLFSFAAFLCWQ
jgi:hypothetical protein